MKLYDVTLEKDIIPKNASIFYEDGVPYMKYVGTTELSNGIKVEVECPKMSLALKGVEVNSDEISYYDGLWDIKKPKRIIYKREMFAVEDAYFTVKTLERTCKKEDLEKELGYKLILK